MLPLVTYTTTTACSQARFHVPKEQERAEVLVKKGPAGFKFRIGETYELSYSFRPKDKMRTSGSSTRFGQMKGVSDGSQLKGTPLLAITATNAGLNVRFSNDGAAYVEGMKEGLSWEDAAGEWVNVRIKTTLGKSMEVRQYKLSTYVLHIIMLSLKAS